MTGANNDTHSEIGASDGVVDRTQPVDRGNGGGVVTSSNGGGRGVAVSNDGALISILERAARDPSVDIDKFERLALMKERMEAQEAKRAFNAAMARAKGRIPPILKNRVVDFTSQKGRTNYRHEDLSMIARTIDPILQEDGLSYRFRSRQDGNKLVVTCIITHALGYSEETELAAPEDHSGNKNAIQAIGSVATYLQRYTLKLALGLASSVDDDAKAANAAETITDEQAEQIKQALDDTNGSISKFAEYFGIEKLTDLPAAKFSAAMTAITNSAKRRAS